MTADRIQVEIFDSHYKAIEHSLAIKDYESAKKHTIKATIALYELAKQSSGAIRENRLREAEKLCAHIEKLDKLVQEKKNKEKEMRAAESHPSKKKDSSPEQDVIRNGGASDRNGDENQRVFEALPVPDISFNDVIGLHDVKEAVQKKVIEPRLHPELYEKYKMKTGGGILMFGPPGTGKTMVAKAIAHETNSKFFSLRCSDLVSKYFGGTEQNLALLFDTARREKNAVIFFDEFEALAVGRDKNNSTVMRRVVTELLTQMQGIKNDNEKDGCSLLVLAATNIPWMIDSAFMRPGRFDERIYVGLPDDDARRGILENNLRGIPSKSTIDIEKIVDATSGFNCADMVQLVTKAKTFPLDREKRGAINDGICTEDFDEALKTVHSSVIKKDIERMVAWRQANG